MQALATLDRPEPGLAGADAFFRFLVTQLRTRAFDRQSLAETAAEIYPRDHRLQSLCKAGAGPALTTVSGWAAELFAQTTGEFVELLRGESIFLRLPSVKAMFDQTGKILFPTETLTTPGLAGDFVGEALPIPVRRTTLGSVTIEPYKLATVTTWSREMARQSSPVIEPLLRELVLRGTRDVIDSKLLDNNAAVPDVRPAGLQTYATGANTAVSAGALTANIVTDIRGRLNQITSLGMGERLVWIMHPSRKVGLSFALTSSGAPQFPDVANDRLVGYPILESLNVPPAVVFLVDAASLITAIAPAPEIMISDAATLHMEDTTPSQIIPGPALPPGTAAPGTIGAIPSPVMSLFQAACYALRLIWDASWAVARPGAIQTVTGAAW